MQCTKNFFLILVLGLTTAVTAATAPETVAHRTGPLTRAERISAQTAIERIWYEHRIWPKENPGPKPSFEQMVPAALIETKADEPVKMTAALKQFWNFEITPSMRQNELDRIERESKDRVTLHQLFAALHNDPYLIAETLARGNLAEKALRNHYAWDAKLHHDARHRAESLMQEAKRSADWSGLDTSFTRSRLHQERNDPAKSPSNTGIELPAAELKTLRDLLALIPVAPREDEAGWYIERRLDGALDELIVESLNVPKRSFNEWWNEIMPGFNGNPATLMAASGIVYKMPDPILVPDSGCDAWDNQINKIRPSARQNHTAVWTGSEMIIWGGYDGSYMNTGGRYNPSTDSWVYTSTGANVPSGRRYHTAVWTGSKMVIWGGFGGSNDSYNSGGQYDPAADSWSVTSTGPIVPAGRTNHSAVWTGGEMIVWGGTNLTGCTPTCSTTYLNSGGRYSPLTDSWFLTATGANLPPPRSLHGAVWTGGVMIVWGGFDGGGNLNSGGQYDPNLDSWTATSVGANVPTGRYYHSMVWTGTEMIVWGGIGGSYLNSGGRYNPGTNTWTATSTGLNVPAARGYHNAGWTGTEMIVWGGINGGGFLNSGGRYNPATNSWTPTASGASAPAGRYYHSAVMTATEMIVFGGFNGGYLSGYGRYNISGDYWITTPNGNNPPTPRDNHTAVWTGAEMIIWGGQFPYTNTGGRYTPATNNWVATSMGANVPGSRYSHAAIWTGIEMIIWGGFNGNRINSGGRYNPASDSWVATSTGANLPSARISPAIWTGSEMIVWGGTTCSTLGCQTNTGGRYAPATDSWQPTSIGANVPSVRAFHSAVWTGSEMIVWGGNIPISPYETNTGGRYVPGTDSWTATSTGANVPDVRNGHGAVWTGSEMIIWGSGTLQSGGRYTPGTDSWITTSTGANVPAGRNGFTTVWTGSEMIIWGGVYGVFMNSGGRYRPVGDTWLPTSLGANVPTPRNNHTAVWTGNGMIIFGGRDAGATFLNDGRIYTLDPPGTPGTSLRGGKSATVNLNWTASAGAAFYNVKRCTGACAPSSVIATPASNSYSEAMDATSYFYTVEAVNVCGVTP